MGPRIERIEAAAYTIPTDFPESDGTLEWDRTTLVLVHLHLCCALEPVVHLEWFHDHARIERMLFDGAAPPVEGRLEEAVSGLTAFATGQSITAAHFTGIGAFERATVGFFEREKKDYARVVLAEQVEVMSLLGNVARDGEAIKVHAHVVLGKRDGTAHGGHLLEGRVWPTLEVVLTEEPPPLRRKSDAETGLALLDLPGRP